MFHADPNLQQVFNHLKPDASNLKVLEVGCGSCSHVDLGRSPYIVGIDISEKQLDRNTVLSEKILGDIEQVDLPKETFDVAICWWVLEHLDHPQLALGNCVEALKEDGLLIIAVPNVMSLKGMITKYTPHAFHIWFYRFIFGEKDAGVNDQVPFRTFLRYALSPRSLRQFAQERDLSVEHFCLYENPRQTQLRHRNWLLNGAWHLLNILVGLVSLGMITVRDTDMILILQKTKAGVTQKVLSSVA